MLNPSHFHPMLVHFPIALVVFGFIAELAALFIEKEICLSKMGFFLLLLGTLSAVAAVLSGVLFTAEMEGAAGEVMETHELFAYITLTLLVAASLTRIYIMVRNSEKPNPKRLAFLLYALAALSVSITGFFGGTLVFNYMMPL
jgi:uncharacterized membrane protein